MENIKYGDTYIKSMATMIARGDIININSFNEYLKYADLDTPVKVSSFELEMLFGSKVDSIVPKYYVCDKDVIKEYYPIDIILYSFMANKWYYPHKMNLLKEVLDMEEIDFSNIARALEYAVSEGDLKLFNLLVSKDINYNAKHYKLRTGEHYSVLDNCLMLAMARMTINGKSVAEKYPREILDYFLSLDIDEINFALLRTTMVLLECIVDDSEKEVMKGISCTEELFNKVREVVYSYDHTF